MTYVHRLRKEGARYGGMSRTQRVYFPDAQTSYVTDIQGDSKLLSEFPWPIVFNAETRK
jgi:hypothetical protein